MREVLNDKDINNNDRIIMECNNAKDVFMGCIQKGFQQSIIDNYYPPIMGFRVGEKRMISIIGILG